MQQQPNFLDSRTILAIVLVGVFWFGWQAYIQKKYNNNQVAPATTQTNTVNSATLRPDADAASPGESDSAAEIVLETKTSSPEKTVGYQSENLNFEISSKGMGIKNIQLNKFTDRSGNLIVMGPKVEPWPFSTSLIGVTEALNFDIKQVSSTEFQGIAVHTGMKITKKISINSNDYALNISTQVESINPQFQGLSTSLVDIRQEAESGGFLTPQVGHQEFVVVHGGSSDRMSISNITEQTTKDYSQVTMLGLSSQYFATAIVDKSDILPEAFIEASPKKENSYGVLTFRPVNPNTTFATTLIGYIGPKDANILEKVDPLLFKTINFGMFSALARPMLQIMKWFYSFVENWGVAIILLTLLVRLVVMPFNIMSYKSMKAMQKIQPLTKELREKYKGDPQTLNKEMMLLMKDHKVNPLGGCLPMLLQFPVFIALYQVFGQSIELYHSPFIFWIKDLSLKDPYYVLPVLMGITMFLQQKLTPTNMDPTQAKILMFMPVIFTIFMVSLPSGLTLYIFVSTLFGILQQIYFLREKEVKTVSTSTAKA